MDETELLSATTAADSDCKADGKSEPPLEWLEAQICELAGHLAAATARFLTLLGDFDARRGWASWDLPSCAAWLSWKCQLSPGTAREQVRVARALRELPVLSAELAAGRMSYAKVRALTRIATPETEGGLAELAGPMTASQLERFTSAHRRVTHADDEHTEMVRRLTWRHEEDGSLALTVRLPPAAGAVVLQALRAAADYVSAETSAASPDAPATGVSAETPSDQPPAPGRTCTPAGLADALVAMAGAYLTERAATADNPDLYHVIVHVGTQVLTGEDVSAETPAGEPSWPVHDGTAARAAAAVDLGHPGYGQRCQLEDGPALSPLTAQIIACDATVSWMLHDAGGNLLDIGRRRRFPTAALRRAVRERDRCRCQFPGCNARIVDIHHIKSWARGGKTALTNLILLCRFHHRIVHGKGYLITPALGGWQFTRADGAVIDRCPCLPEPEGHISDCHDAPISMDTIVPAWYGDKLDLDLAIWSCFANVKVAEQRRQKREAEQAQASDTAAA